MDYPNRKIITLAEREVVKKEEVQEEKEVHLMEEQEKSQEKVVEEADRGEILFLRRTISGLKTKEEQQENIFHSRCVVQGKVCSLIIDGVICANVVSLSMVTKLNLHACTHPHPYNIYNGLIKDCR